MQNKITERDDYTPIRMIKIVMTPNVEEDTEDLYHSYTADGKTF